MELTEVCIGCKRSKLRKMEPSREKSGNHLKSISETGETTSRKVSVFNSTRVETSMRVCGLKIKDMAKVPTGELKVRNSEESTQETGMKIKSMEEELSSTRMETDTMVTGSMDSHKERDV